MRATTPGSPGVPSAAACAEAAAWIARLHGAERTADVDRGLRHWLAASAEHRAAFELANEIWTDTERWPQPEAPAFVRRSGVGVLLAFPRALAAAAVVAAITILGVLFHPRAPELVTQVGEQRTIALEDGTRVSMNTATRLRVAFDEATRSVELEQGEALFEVAKRPDWPFVVTVGKQRITALGTSFVVRRDGEQAFAVTLVEGRVAVSTPVAGSSGLEHSGTVGEADTVVLTAGERLTFTGHAAPKVDRPSVSQVMAWQQGQVILDHTPLAEAIREMNRYSVVQLAIEDPSVAALEVTGVFRSGDSVSFAQAVAETYDIEVVREPRRLRLTR